MKRLVTFYAKDGRKVFTISPHWFKALCNLIAEVERETPCRN